MKITDNEIIKALECCGAGWDGCEPCPLCNYDGDCLESIVVDILNLITRQKAEIEALIAGQETLQKYIAEKNAEIERLKTLNSKLEAEVFMQRENDAIHTEPEDENWFAPLKTVDEIKAEAIKEFAERLDKEVDHMLNENWLFEAQAISSLYSIKNFIEKIKKEMVGDV